MILLTTLIFTLSAGAISYLITSVSPAEVLIAPSDCGDSKGCFSAFSGQFGGLASLAGVNLGGSGNKAEAIATLNSRALTEHYIREQNLLPILFAKRWNTQIKQFTPDGHGKVPTLWDGNKLFRKKIRKFSEDKKTGLISLAIEWTDPAIAAQWANDLVKLTNHTLRDRAIAESNRNLGYLNQQLERSSVVELRQAIYRLIETEVKNVMVAEGSEEYAFKIIDPAVAPEEKSKPKGTLIVAVALVLGLLLSGFYALITSARTAPRK